MQDKDSTFLNTTKNLYSNHAYDFPPGNQHLPPEHYANSSYTHNPNSNPYGNSNMAGVPYEDGSIHSHFISSQENSFMNQDVNSERKTTVRNLGYETYSSDHGTCHSQVMNTQMTNVPSENVHSQMATNVNLVQRPHQPSNVNIIQSHQQNRQVQFSGQPSNSWSHYQELQPRVQNMHHHHQQNQHFLPIIPNQVGLQQQQQQYPHESSSSNNLYDSATMRTNNFHFPPQPPPVQNPNEGKGMPNPLQSLQDMVMSDGNVTSMQCPTGNTVTEEQCSAEFEKPASAYITPDEYQNCLPPSSETAVMFLSPPPSSGESVAVPVVTDVTEQQTESTAQDSTVKECSQEDTKFEIVSESIKIIENVGESGSDPSIEPGVLNHNMENTEISSTMYVGVGDDGEECDTKVSQSHADNFDVNLSTSAVDNDLKTILGNGVKKELHEICSDVKVNCHSMDCEDIKLNNETKFDTCNIDNSCKIEKTLQNQELNNVDQKCEETHSATLGENNLCEVDSKSQQKLDSASKTCVWSTEGLAMSCNEHTPCENSEELMSTNHDGEEFENEVCSSSDVVTDGVISVKAKTLHKTVRSVKLKTVKRLKKFSHSNRKAVLAVSKPSSNCESEIAKNPVRVVIHRIRANNDSETWRIPTSEEKLEEDYKNINGNDKIETPENVSKTGPQIIILSPAVTRKKSGKAACKPKALFPTDSKSSSGTVSTNDTAFVSTENPEANVSANEPSETLIAKQSSPSKKRRRSQKINISKTKKKKTLKSKKFQKNQENSKVIQKVKKIIKKFTGPYIHMIDSNNITIVNVTLKGDEKDKKPVHTKTVAETGFTKRPQVGHTSTLSPNYDAFNVDRSWTCIFCHKGSHTNGLGDLFGPYYVKESAFDGDSTPKDRSRHCSKKVNSKRKKPEPSECFKRNLTKKPKQGSTAASSVRQSDSPNVMDLEKEMPSYVEEEVDCAKKEVWIHEDCAVWCQTISIVGQQVHGLEEAVEESRDCVCSVCKMNGATMGCWNKGCSERYHFACALQKSCEINIEKFALICSQHKKGKLVERLKLK